MDQAQVERTQPLELVARREMRGPLLVVILAAAAVAHSNVGGVSFRAPMPLPRGLTGTDQCRAHRRPITPNISSVRT